MFTPLHVPHVTCQVSHVTCHVSHVTCHILRVICPIFCIFLFFGQSSRASWLRVCYQRGLPRLVFLAWLLQKEFIQKVPNLPDTLAPRHPGRPAAASPKSQVDLPFWFRAPNYTCRGRLRQLTFVEVELLS